MPTTQSIFTGRTLLASFGDLIAPLRTRGADGVLEGFVLFAAAHLAEPYLAALRETYAPGLSASAYWVPLILISLQYGLLASFLAATVATSLVLTANPGFAIGVTETVAAHTVRVWLEPLCFYALAALLGGVRSHDLETRTRLTRQLGEESRTVDEVARRYVHLRDRVEQLERALATGATPSLRNAGVGPDDLTDLPAKSCVAALYRVLKAAANGAEIMLIARWGDARVKLANPNETDGDDIASMPAAAIVPITDGAGHTLIEVHIRSIDPDLFGPDDHQYFRDLCDRMGQILARRGVSDLTGIEQGGPR